jgi:hypothetical protein
MTTTEILEMALKVATLGRATSETARITIGPRFLAATEGIGITVEPNVATDDHVGLGHVEMSGSGLTIDEAARDLLPSVYRAEEAIRVRAAKHAEREAKKIESLNAATGRGAR